MKISICIFVIAQISISACGPVVTTQNGQIHGRYNQTFKGTSYAAFEKVPYATPPVGKLRFQPPRPPNNWEGVLETQDLDKICYQLVPQEMDSEDCLYLNIYTPQLPSEDKNLSLPVMFYIPGKVFSQGSALELQPDGFLDNGVVTVAPNYRIGFFGYLSTGDGLMHGNNGLKDLLLALQWVRDNVKAFGGDPNKVTIFGQGAGGVCVGYFLLNKKAEGLFSGAISQSGSVLEPIALQKEPKVVFSNFAKHLNQSLELNGTSEIVEYIQEAPAEELTDAAIGYFIDNYNLELSGVSTVLRGHFFGPVLEPEHPNSFITRKMFSLLKEGNVVKVPFMIGFTSEECLVTFSELEDSLWNMSRYDQNLDLLVPIDMKIESKEEQVKMGSLIRDIYTKGDSFSAHTEAAVRFCSDNFITRATIKHAELYSNFAKTYFYVFSYDGPLGDVNVTYEGAGKVSHGEELKYLFCSGENCNFDNYTNEDQLTQKRLIKLWTDFAKYGNPTPEPFSLLGEITWPSVSVKDGNFLYLDIDVNLTIKNQPIKTYEKWNELYRSLRHEDFDTY